MAKDKKKKDKKKESGGKKANKAATGVQRLKALGDNPLVADVVAAALVATAAALKDPRKARQLAAHTGDQLTDLAREGAERGTALWQLATEIGRRSLDALTADAAAVAAPKQASKAKPKAKAAKVKPVKAKAPAKVGAAKAKAKPAAKRPAKKSKA